MPKMTMVQALNTALDQEMERDDQVVLLGEDIGINGGVFRVTEGLFEKYGVKRRLGESHATSGARCVLCAACCVLRAVCCVLLVTFCVL